MTSEDKDGHRYVDKKHWPAHAEAIARPADRELAGDAADIHHDGSDGSVAKRKAAIDDQRK
jgi:hypothetical protein